MPLKTEEKYSHPKVKLQNFLNFGDLRRFASKNEVEETPPYSIAGYTWIAILAARQHLKSVNIGRKASRIIDF